MSEFHYIFWPGYALGLLTGMWLMYKFYQWKGSNDGRDER